MNMKFADFVRKLAVVVFIIAIIGAFPVAKKLSTTITITKYEYVSDRVDKETDKAEYVGVLVASWVSSGIVCVFLYGLGEILEFLYVIKKKMSALDATVEKLSSVINQDNSNQ